MKKTALILLSAICLYACQKSGTGNTGNIIADLSLDSLKKITVNIPGDYYMDMGFFNGNTGVAVSRTGHIIRTADGGNNWVQAAVPALAGLNLQKVQLTDGQTGYALGFYYPNATTTHEGVLLKTTDAGLNWIRVGNTGSNQFYGMYFFDNQHGYLAGGGLYQTSDGGQNWVKLNKPNAVLDGVKFKNANEGVITSGNGTFYKTSNGGASWDSVKTVYSDILYDIYFTDSKAYVTRLGFPSLIDIDNPAAVSPKPFEAKKMLFLDDQKSIGIGNMYFPNAQLTTGTIHLTNDGWNTFQEKIDYECISFTAIAKMDDHRIMLLGYRGIEAVVYIYSY